MDCIVPGVAKSQTQLSNFHLEKTTLSRQQECLQRHPTPSSLPLRSTAGLVRRMRGHTSWADFLFGFLFRCSKKWIPKELAMMNDIASTAYIFLKNFIVSDLTIRSSS